jgi:hypothetical protein
MIPMAISNTRVNGRMIIIVVRGLCMGLMMLIGLSMWESLKQGRRRDLGRCSFEMVIGIRGNLGGICLGGREG